MCMPFRRFFFLSFFFSFFLNRIPELSSVDTSNFALHRERDEDDDNDDDDDERSHRR